MVGTTRSDRGSDQSLGKIQSDVVNNLLYMQGYNDALQWVEKELRRSRREESHSQKREQGTAGKGPEE